MILDKCRLCNSKNLFKFLDLGLHPPADQFRKSLALYYLCEPSAKVSKRGKALFSPSESQNDDKELLELIKLRSSVEFAHKVYIK